MTPRLWILAALCGLGACTCREDVFQRMESQRKYLPYQESELFADGRAMRPPPPGTVPRELLLRGAIPAAGKTAGGAVIARMPIDVAPEVMARGKKSFEIICATCHGLVGDGDSMVARKMALRPPPSLLALPEHPVGWYFDVITYGFGLMPNYRYELKPEDRWAVVAYVLALRRSQKATLADVPPEERSALMGGSR